MFAGEEKTTEKSKEGQKGRKKLETKIKRDTIES
jgi:hypothetical protein